ncbi:hypothetical protein CSPHI_08740 [Corynebacterium sphenisci DSM 44792]|uniref:Heme oxygenase n=1 Tax=Corynebacterium sphenisci DSM 44792 TaxID=1437874 RepID=A0A1L7CZ78_9CORY|nr:biliverdin-producing heme oxygenase [Corynebacterium sphenisci]APT91093.1 hypothetical protein CSPHI_08740 [Corynebacterium sphenisci DSM 44792]
MTAPEKTTVSALLRKATIEVHEEAENSGFMNRMLNGLLTREAYVDYQGQMLCIYRALEGAGEALAGTPVVEALADERLLRTAALSADLDFLHGAEGAAERVRPTEATAAYVAELHRVAEEGDQVAFAAHHYVRYLGDLAGGQIIATLVSRIYGFGEDGVQGLRFPGIDKLKAYRDTYRGRLDSLAVLDEHREELVAHARTAFTCNTAVFADLDRRHPAE